MSDIQGALNAGLQAALVKTGKYQPDDEQLIEGVDWHLINSIADLPELLGC